MRKLAVTLLVAGAILSSSQGLFAVPKELKFDLVVYGSTSGGVMTAVAAAREGLQVAVVDSVHHVGGMMASGLDTTDRGVIPSIGGIPREFFERMGQHYNEPIEFDFEPHVAEHIFNDMLREAHVTLFLDARLREIGGVAKRGARITSITTEDGLVFSAREFVDATYEGDLMVQAGVSNTWGREPASQYHEWLGGVLGTLRNEHQFTVNLSPYADEGSILPEVSSIPRGDLGSGDKRLGAYTFRLCFSGDKANQVPLPKPEGYDPARYELLARLLGALQKYKGRELNINDVVMPKQLQGGKFDINSKGAFSMDYIGANYDFPTANYKRRAEIIADHYRYEAGFFYFLAHDPRVPPALQRDVNRYGLAKDEFTDTNNWPWRLYVREDRRMLGEYVMTQGDVWQNTNKTDSIGEGSYNIDSHNTQRFINAIGYVQNEGDMWVLPPKPYDLSYRSIVPRRSEVVNLLVPVCLSASHVAYSSIRQEPVFMIAGQGAGVAASIAAHRDLDVQDIPVPELQQKLIAQHAAVLHWPLPNSK